MTFSRYRLLFIAALLLTSQNSYSAENITKADTIKVMTYNIHHGNPPEMAKSGTINLKAVAQVINKYHPDLVALQEVDVNTARSGVKLNESAKLARLTGMHYYFARALYYQKGQYGDAVLSRFPIQEGKSYVLHNLEGAQAETRSLCLVRIQTGHHRSVYFASTHLDAFTGENNRLYQAKQLVHIIQSLSAPIIIAGDLNTTPNSRTINFLTNYFTRSCNSGCTPTIPRDQPKHKIDYILYRPDNKFQVIKTKVASSASASDHLPYLVTLIVDDNDNTE